LHKGTDRSLRIEPSTSLARTGDMVQSAALRPARRAVDRDRPVAAPRSPPTTPAHAALLMTFKAFPNVRFFPPPREPPFTA
jgi:hypothetical protein